MPVTSGNIVFSLSNPAASSGNVTSQGNPNASLGSWLSTTTIVNDSLDNLFSDITGDENATDQVDYRCVFIDNTSNTNSLLSAVAWISGQRFTTTHGSNLFNVTAHGFVNGQTVRIDAELSTDSLPGGYSNSTTYYIISATTNTFELSLTSGGGAVTMTSDGTGAVRQYGYTITSIATDNVGPVLMAAGVAQATSVANTTTAPSAVSAFSSPTTKATGLSLGTIAPSGCVAVWIKRAATNSAALNNDGMTLGVQGDTTA